MNSSTVTSASFRMARNVPVANSECIGMTQPVVLAPSDRFKHNVTAFLPDLNKGHAFHGADCARA